MGCAVVWRGGGGGIWGGGRERKRGVGECGARVVRDEHGFFWLWGVGGWGREVGEDGWWYGYVGGIAWDGVGGWGFGLPRNSRSFRGRGGEGRGGWVGEGFLFVTFFGFIFFLGEGGVGGCSLNSLGKRVWCGVVRSVCVCVGGGGEVVFFLQVLHWEGSVGEGRGGFGTYGLLWILVRPDKKHLSELNPAVLVSGPKKGGLHPFVLLTSFVFLSLLLVLSFAVKKKKKRQIGNGCLRSHLLAFSPRCKKKHTRTTRTTCSRARATERKRGLKKTKEETNGHLCCVFPFSLSLALSKIFSPRLLSGFCFRPPPFFPPACSRTRTQKDGRHSKRDHG